MYTCVDFQGIRFVGTSNMHTPSITALDGNDSEGKVGGGGRLVMIKDNESLAHNG